MKRCMFIVALLTVVLGLYGCAWFNGQQKISPSETGAAYTEKQESVPDVRKECRYRIIIRRTSIEVPANADIVVEQDDGASPAVKVTRPSKPTPPLEPFRPVAPATTQPSRSAPRLIIRRKVD